MGLDQFAFAGGDEDTRNEISYWRKHPNLHGWMENLWQEKFAESIDALSQFNGVELELTWEDLDRLEEDIESGKMSQLNTAGFFFGDCSDEYYKIQDLDFIKRARAEIFVGLQVFYNSSW